MLLTWFNVNRCQDVIKIDFREYLFAGWGVKGL